MAVPDDTNLINLINSNLPDATPGRQRVGTASFVRAVLIALVNWVKAGMTNTISTWQRLPDNQPGGSQTETIYHTGKVIVGRTYDDGSTSKLQADTANIGLLNGMPAAPAFVITSAAETTLPAQRRYLFAELPAQNGGTYDFIHFTLVAKPWDNNSGAHLVLTMYAANRGGFKAFHTTQGDQDAVGIYAILQTDGRVLLYVVTDNVFRAISVKVHQHGQAVLYPAFQLVENPPGTLIYDTLSSAIFKPLMALKTRFTSFTALNSDGAYPSPISDAGAAQIAYGANYLPGQSDFAFILTNLASRGFTWWKQTSTGTKTFLAYLTDNGNLGLGTPDPKARLHLRNPVEPFNQLILENNYTPTGRNDPNGQVGTVTWDNSGIFLKTGNGWGKATIQLL